MYYRITSVAALVVTLLGPWANDARSGSSRPWKIDRIDGVGRVIAIERSSKGSFVRTAKGWHRATFCGDAVCLKPARAPARNRSPSGGLPDGRIASSAGNGFVRAWYAEPTGRYDHAILGDAVEAGAIIAENASGKRLTLRLPESEVFEDITPRLADLDGDGSPELVTIRTNLDRGGSLVVYGTRDGQLREIAHTPEIGRTHRWLNVAGIADFDGDGTRDVAIVLTPHIGGTLEFWSLRDGRLRRRAALSGFSNHEIRSRHLDLSAMIDIDGDGVTDLALPDAARSTLRMVSLRGTSIVSLASARLPARIVHNIGALKTPAGPAFLLGLDNGTLVALTRTP